MNSVADGEQDRRRIRADAEPAGDRVQPAAPRREDEQHEPRREPEERIALLQAAAADELEHDQDQQQRRDRRGDRDAERASLSLHLLRGASRTSAASPRQSASVTLSM